MARSDSVVAIATPNNFSVLSDKLGQISEGICPLSSAIDEHLLKEKINSPSSAAKMNTKVLSRKTPFLNGLLAMAIR